MDMLRFSDRFQAVLSLFSPQIGWIITVVKWVGMLRFIQADKFKKDLGLPLASSAVSNENYDYLIGCPIRCANFSSLF